MGIRTWLSAILLATFPLLAEAQTVSGVRSYDGGVAPLFSLVGGSGSLYLDNQGTQGYIYNFREFQSYNFRTPGGQAWSGALTTLGPQLTIGLIQGANQPGFGVILPPPPRQPAGVPAIESGLLEEIP